MLYTAKCFWPGVSEEKLRAAVGRAGSRGGDAPTALRGALYWPGDELVLCVFEASSRTSVKLASEEAGMPCERVIESVWVEP
jgi:hypothetical protein